MRNRQYEKLKNDLSEEESNIYTYKLWTREQIMLCCTSQRHIVLPLCGKWKRSQVMPMEAAPLNHESEPLTSSSLPPHPDLMLHKRATEDARSGTAIPNPLQGPLSHPITPSSQQPSSQPSKSRVRQTNIMFHKTITFSLIFKKHVCVQCVTRDK